jgi:hypothetical protein
MPLQMHTIHHHRHSRSSRCPSRGMAIVFDVLGHQFRGHLMVRKPYSSRPEHGCAVQRQPSNPPRRTVGASLSAVEALKHGKPGPQPAINKQSSQISRCTPRSEAVRIGPLLDAVRASDGADRELVVTARGTVVGSPAARGPARKRQFGIATPFEAPLGHRPFQNSGPDGTDTNWAGPCKHTKRKILTRNLIRGLQGYRPGNRVGTKGTKAVFV